MRLFVAVLGALLYATACSDTPANPSDFSCEDTRQVEVWRARIFGNFSAGARIAQARDERNPDVTLRQMRDLHLQLRNYFLSEPMPTCMREAIRIYVDGTEALQAEDSELLTSMQHMSATIDRFGIAVASAKPEWAQRQDPAP